jgi:dihydrolipoamide dehydrogenase
MSEVSFDLIVIGAGPGGYVAAIRASQLGMKVAVVEQRKTMGGVCLNEGCIPSKALLDSSEHFALARDKFVSHGIDINPPTMSVPRMVARKDDVVKKLTDGIAYLFKKNKVQVVSGAGCLTAPQGDGLHRVEVTAAAGTTLLVAKKVLLATGGNPSKCRACPLMVKQSSAPRKLSVSVKCPSIWLSLAPGISAWSWDLSGGGLAPG